MGRGTVRGSIISGGGKRVERGKRLNWPREAGGTVATIRSGGMKVLDGLRGKRISYSE